MTDTVKLKENRNMKLTGADINKAYTEQLTKLLLNGYNVIVANQNGSLEQENGRYNRILLENKILLEKGGECFEFGFWGVGINSNTEKQILGMMKHDRLSLNYCYEEEKNLLAGPFTYYGYTFGMGSEHKPYQYFAFSTEEEVLELYEKRKQRAEYRDWLRNCIVNTFKVAKTNYTGFKKDITVVSLPNTYILINKNGREAVLHKSTGRLSTY